jgi:hypothetical protein
MYVLLRCAVGHPEPIAAQYDATESGRVGVAADAVVAVAPGESPIPSPPGMSVGFVDLDSVDLAGHWVWAHLHAAAYSAGIR